MCGFFQLCLDYVIVQDKFILKRVLLRNILESTHQNSQRDFSVYIVAKLNLASH